MNTLEKILGAASAPKSHILAHSSFFMGTSYAKSVNSLMCLYTMHANVSRVAFATIHGLSSHFLVTGVAVVGFCSHLWHSLVVSLHNFFHNVLQSFKVSSVLKYIKAYSWSLRCIFTSSSAPSQSFIRLLSCCTIRIML